MLKTKAFGSTVDMETLEVWKFNLTILAKGRKSKSPSGLWSDSENIYALTTTACTPTHLIPINLGYDLKVTGKGFITGLSNR